MTDKSKTGLLAAAFCACVFLKCVAFNWCCFNSVLLSSIFTDPKGFFSFYIAKLIPGLLLTAILLVTKRKWWSIVMLVAIDLWAIANLIYFRANGLLIDVPAMLMATNLKGFESSVFAFLRFKDLLLPVLTVLYCVAFYFIKDKRRHWRAAIIIVVIAIAYNLSGGLERFSFFLKNKYSVQYDINCDRQEIIDIFGRTGLRVFAPFHSAALSAKPGLSVAKSASDFAQEYARANSILHYGIAMFVIYANSPDQSEAIVSSSEIDGIYHPQDSTGHASRSVVLILVESLESWPFANDELANIVCPNLNALRSNHTAYYSKVRSMAKHGVSGDGQMMLVSGMLPLNSGAACILHGDNKWPGIPQLYQSSVLIDPANGIWNQHVMTEKYGFKSTIEGEDGLSDEEIFKDLCAAVDTLKKPYCALAITCATHSPFKHVTVKGLSLPQDMPQYLHDYLVCLNYTDQCIGMFLKKYFSDSSMQDVAIIVTGDHTVFKESVLHEFQKWDGANLYHIPAEESFCPLFVHSANTRSFECDKLVYQMDLYPTVLNKIDVDSYWWEGFGVNLLDTLNINIRHYSEEQALDISDRMIRSDYFESAKSSILTDFPL